jgi:hypothetical protein
MGGIGVVHNFEYNGICICDMKSRTMLCNFYKELSIPIFGEEKELELKNHWFQLFQKLQRINGVFLKALVVNLWLYK